MFSSFSKDRVVSGLLAGIFGLVIVSLGGWWFTFSLCVIVHLALLEFFRMAEFTGIRPATKTTLVACQLLLPLRGDLLQPLGPIAEISSPALLRLDGSISALP